MKKAAFYSLAMASTLLLASNVLALPAPGAQVRVTDGLGGSPGGEFNLDIIGVGANGSNDYFSFCLEKTEYFTPGNTYTIQSVADYADGGGPDNTPNDPEPGKDYLSAATKWVMWNYFTNQGIFSQAIKSALFATDVQNIIWALEDEQTYSSALYTDVLAQGQKPGGYTFTGGVVKVLNIVTPLQNGSFTKQQSQLVAEVAPVPEPANTLLFGVGMAGLAGMARRRTT